jgi:anti-sigma factor RsiW
MRMRLFRRRTAPMPCRDAVEAVTAYLEGAMSPADSRRFQAHLGGCEHCTAYVEQIRATIELTGHIESDDLAPDAREALLGVFQAWAAEGA